VYETQSDEIVEHMLDRRLSAVRVDENPRDIQFRGVQQPSPPNRIGFSASQPSSDPGPAFFDVDIGHSRG